MTASSKHEVVIIDCTDAAYNPDIIKTKAFGGIQNGTVNLSILLHDAGFKVDVVNNTPVEDNFNGVEWHNIASSPVQFKNPRNSIIIANNDPNLFQPYAQDIQNGAKPFLWIHNSLSLKRFRKNKRWKSYFKFKPYGVFLSENALKGAPFYYTFRERRIIPHFLKDSIFETEKPVAQFIADGPPKAAFISHPHRGLNKVVRLWKSHILPVCPDAILEVYCNLEAVENILGCSKEELSKFNVVVQPRLAHQELLNKLSQARALFYPGSKDETFCFAAAEALALGVPVVTQGIGSLKDRVIHGQNGFVEPNDERFADALLRVFQDDALWMQLRENALHSAQTLRKEDILTLWEAYFSDALSKP